VAAGLAPDGLDRGYAQYGLLQDIRDADSSFVCRLADNAAFEVVEEHELSSEALEVGIVRDATVRLGCKGTRDKMDGPVRVIEIECVPHRKAGRHTARGGPEQGDTILVATDRMDLPPEVVGLIFRYRWQVEIFFRFFKHVLGCRHLLSTCQNGIEIQTYAAILACLLIALWTGRRPTLRTHRMLCWYFLGWAEEEELLAHVAKLQRQDEAPNNA
jgi:IS4 transposase